MPAIFHRFRNHHIDSQTEILILGTFNPDIPNGPNFFYGRARNYLWTLLPGCWGLPSLKRSQITDKINFMSEYKIDFVDIVKSIDVPLGSENNVNDNWLDGRIKEWNDVVSIIDNLPDLRSVYFTRKTFQGIPNIRERILEIMNHCLRNKIRFCMLETPARYVNAEKQRKWMNTVRYEIDCLNNV